MKTEMVVSNGLRSVIIMMASIEQIIFAITATFIFRARLSDLHSKLIEKHWVFLGASKGNN